VQIEGEESTPWHPRYSGSLVAIRFSSYRIFLDVRPEHAVVLSARNGFHGIVLSVFVRQRYKKNEGNNSGRDNTRTLCERFSFSRIFNFHSRGIFFIRRYFQSDVVKLYSFGLPFDFIAC